MKTMPEQPIQSPVGAVLIVPHPDQRVTYFIKGASIEHVLVDQEVVAEGPDFSRYSYQAQSIMAKMGYPLNHRAGLQGGKGILVPIGTGMVNAPAQGPSRIMPECTGIGYQEHETSIQVSRRYAGIIPDPTSPTVTGYESDFSLPYIFSCNMVTIIFDEEGTSSKDTQMMEAGKLEQTSDIMQENMDCRDPNLN